MSHVTQTQKAKREQKADYAFLVTTGKQTKNFTGYKIEKGVIILRPEAVLPFAKIVREQIIEADRLKIPYNKRDQVANKALNFLNSC